MAEYTLDVIKYINILWRRKWFIILPVVLMTAMAFVATYFIPKKYQAQATILVEEQRLMNPLISNIAVATSVSGRLPYIKEQILSWQSIVAMITKLHLDKDIRTQGQLEDLVRKIRSNLYVTMPERSNIVNISYISHDPLITKLVVEEIVNAFIAKNKQSQQQETNVAIDFINNQIKLYDYKIKQGQIGLYEKKLQDLLVDATEKHPIVIELRKKIATLKNSLKETTPLPIDEEVLANNPQLAEVYNEIQQEYSKLKAEQESEEPDNLERDIKINEEIYAMLKRRLETARLTQRLESSKEGLRFEVVNPPRIPLKPFSPNRVKYTLLGTFMGFCIGMFFLLLAEFTDTSFKGIQDAKAWLSHYGPVIGELSMFNKEELEANVRSILRAKK